MNDIGWLILAIVYAIFAPVAGCILAGVDRKLSARMQRRQGPPIMQPYYDVRKFMEKEQITSNSVQDFYVACYLLFIIVTGVLFFAGQDFLLVIFTLTLGETFLVLAAYSSGSPFSQIGAQRELYMAMAFEPIFLFVAICMYLETGSFSISDMVGSGELPSLMMIGVFLAFIYGITMKLRKSPFDLSMSHHAHQDLVRGLTTEFSGKTLAMIEISHWYENIMLLGIIALFFADGTITGFTIGLIAALVIYFVEILIDNGFARMTWQTALKSGWLIGLVLGLGNVIAYILL
ncbi:MAG: NADH-quinone oxidoreductase subunit H [Candidatus Methanomethylophilaceae archaeon]|nr:NADH-quinone oxidoreductase subunit H [Candidatus Methanomethylophilaceae archaeon]